MEHYFCWVWKCPERPSWWSQWHCKMHVIYPKTGIRKHRTFQSEGNAWRDMACSGLTNFRLIGTGNKAGKTMMWLGYYSKKFGLEGKTHWMHVSRKKICPIYFRKFTLTSVSHGFKWGESWGRAQEGGDCSGLTERWWGSEPGRSDLEEI